MLLHGGVVGHCPGEFSTPPQRRHPTCVLLSKRASNEIVPHSLLKMAYLSLSGDSCFTPAERDKLKGRLNAEGPLKASSVKVRTVSGTWVYYAHIEGDASTAQDRLKQLLPIQREASTPLEHVGYSQKYYVTPRYNSPWSTKATSIAHVCGFGQQIHRIERGRILTVEFEQPYSDQDVPFRDILHDRMTENLALGPPDLGTMFAEGRPSPLEVVDIFTQQQDFVQVLKDYNQKRGLHLDQAEMEYLVDRFAQLGRPPNDIELFMFAQVNSEHCRHKQVS